MGPSRRDESDTQFPGTISLDRLTETFLARGRFPLRVSVLLLPGSVMVSPVTVSLLSSLLAVSSIPSFSWQTLQHLEIGLEPGRGAGGDFRSEEAAESL